jgi:hypothetical protein
MKKIPLCPPLRKGEFMRNKITHPHPNPLPSREREIMVKGLYRKIATRLTPLAMTVFFCLFTQTLKHSVT